MSGISVWESGVSTLVELTAPRPGFCCDASPLQTQGILSEQIPQSSKSRGEVAGFWDTEYPRLPAPTVVEGVGYAAGDGYVKGEMALPLEEEEDSGEEALEVGEGK